MPFPYGSNDLRRTVSTLDVNSGNCFYPIRESQSFTNGSPSIYHKEFQDEKSEDDEKQGNHICFICTRQVYSEEPFYVYEQMLNYRGEKYSEKDIAPIWKKDCRMWLWKTNKRKITKKVIRTTQKSKASLSKIFQKLSLLDAVATYKTFHCIKHTIRNKY